MEAIIVIFMKYVSFANLATFVARISPMLTLASCVLFLAMRMANESAQFPLDTGPLRCSSAPVLLRLPAVPSGCGLSPPRCSTVDSWPHDVYWCQHGVFYFEKQPDVVCYFGALLPVCAMLNSAELLRRAPASPPAESHCQMCVQVCGRVALDRALTGWWGFRGGATFKSC